MKNILLFLIITATLKLTPQTKEVFELLIGINSCIIILSFIFISREKYIYSSELVSYILVSIFLALGIKIKYISFIAFEGLNIYSKFTNYFLNHSILVTLGIILFMISIYALVVIKRVIKTASRFSLDSLQLKQISIEADFNAEKITIEEALNRKLKLQKEVNFLREIDDLTMLLILFSKIGIITSIVSILVSSAISTFKYTADFSYYLKINSILIIPELLIYQFMFLLLSISIGYLTHSIFKKVIFPAKESK